MCAHLSVDAKRSQLEWILMSTGCEDDGQKGGKGGWIVATKIQLGKSNLF
jgi:hypothetical protein